MKSKPPFYKQQTPYSCVPACLRMVLSGLGVDRSESELCILCDCTPFGTDALKAVDAARSLGFANSAKYTLSIVQLEKLVNQGEYPIVFVDMLPIIGIQEIHSIVIIDISGSEVTAYDPLQGEKILPLTVFMTAWSLMRNLVILIQI